jgi:hypothetical protein
VLCVVRKADFIIPIAEVVMRSTERDQQFVMGPELLQRPHIPSFF